MIILGLLLILAMVGLSFALMWANDGVFTAPATTVELFGNQIDTTVGQAFLAGAVVGALTLLGMVMIFAGLANSARRNSTARHQLRDHRQEMQEMKRQQDATATDMKRQQDVAAKDVKRQQDVDVKRRQDAAATDLAAHRAATDSAADGEGISTRR